MERIDNSHASLVRALVEEAARKRRRPSQRDKDWAILNGLTLRKRGRPRKDEPANVFGGRSARKTPPTQRPSR